MKYMSLKNMTDEEKKQRKRKQKNEAQKRYYRKNKDYYKNYNKEHNFYKDKCVILQSKIDKANEYLESHFIFDDKNGEYYQTHTFDKDNVKELHDILKEDK